MINKLNNDHAVYIAVELLPQCYQLHPLWWDKPDIYNTSYLSYNYSQMNLVTQKDIIDIL